MKAITKSSDPDSVLMPENITKLDATNLAEIYEEFRVQIENRASKKTDLLNIKPITSFSDELINFNPSIKTVDFNGQVYIVPDSKTLLMFLNRELKNK